MSNPVSVKSNNEEASTESNSRDTSGSSGSPLGIHTFTLRIDRQIVKLVDEAVVLHPVIRNRNTWIVNAIVEQLKRERNA